MTFTDYCILASFLILVPAWLLRHPRYRDACVLLASGALVIAGASWPSARSCVFFGLIAGTVCQPMLADRIPANDDA